MRERRDTRKKLRSLNLYGVEKEKEVMEKVARKATKKERRWRVAKRRVLRAEDGSGGGPGDEGGGGFEGLGDEVVG
jgi:hypothetical protein